jgi:hypothetical protein
MLFCAQVPVPDNEVPPKKEQDSSLTQVPQCDDEGKYNSTIVTCFATEDGVRIVNWFI